VTTPMVRIANCITETYIARLFSVIEYLLKV